MYEDLYFPTKTAIDAILDEIQSADFDDDLEESKKKESDDVLDRIINSGGKISDEDLDFLEEYAERKFKTIDDLDDLVKMLKAASLLLEGGRM